MGTLHVPRHGSLGGVVLGHCFTCSRHTGILREIGQALTAEGFMVLRFDFSGNGQSQGDFGDSSYSKHMAEIQSAVALLTSKGIDWIGLAGHSMGAAIAVLSAAQLPEVRAVCTLAGRLSGLNPTAFLSAAQQSDLAADGQVAFVSRGRRLTLSRRFFTDAAQHHLPGAIRALKIPLLIVHGNRDDIISVTEAQQAREFNPAHSRVEIVDQADHMFSDPSHRRTVSRLIANWFIEQRRRSIAEPQTASETQH